MIYRNDAAKEVEIRDGNVYHDADTASSWNTVAECEAWLKANGYKPVEEAPGDSEASEADSEKDDEQGSVSG